MFGEVSLADWAGTFGLVLARLSFVVFLMPGIGEQAVSARIRLFLLLGLSMAITSSGVVPVPDVAGFAAYFPLLLDEITIGVTLGVSLRLVIWILSIAGSIIAQSIGLSQFLGVALDQEAQTITANILSMAGIVLLLSADYHVAVFASIINLYTEVPAGFGALAEMSLLMNAVFAAFSFAVLLSWPFVAVNFFYNICLGFINKALPQMMVAFVGAPFIVGAGLVLLAVSFATLLVTWLDRVPDYMAWI